MPERHGEAACASPRGSGHERNWDLSPAEKKENDMRYEIQARARPAHGELTDTRARSQALAD